MHSFQEIYKNLDDHFENKRYQRKERTWFSGFFFKDQLFLSQNEIQNVCTVSAFGHPLY